MASYPKKGWHLAYKSGEEDVNMGPVHIRVLQEKYRSRELKGSNYIYHGKINDAQWTRLKDVEGLREYLETDFNESVQAAPVALPILPTATTSSSSNSVSFAASASVAEPTTTETAPMEAKKEQVEVSGGSVARRLPQRSGGIIKEGWMETHTPKLIGNSWQRRYAILTAASFTLFTSSAAQQNDEPALVHIVLKHSHLSDTLPVKFRRSSESFVLLPGDPTAKALYLNCESKEDYVEWFSLMEQTIADLIDDLDAERFKTYRFLKSSAKNKQSRVSVSQLPAEEEDKDEEQEEAKGMDADGNITLDWSNLIVKGYMKKLGGGKLRSVWQERFFVLCGSHLVWATDEHTLLRDQFINGHADMAQCIVERTAKFGNGHPDVFSVRWKSRLVNEKVYYLEANTNEQLGVWMHFIQNEEWLQQKKTIEAEGEEGEMSRKHQRSHTFVGGKGMDVSEDYKIPPPPMFLAFDEASEEAVAKAKEEAAALKDFLLNHKDDRIFAGVLNTSHFDRTMTHMGKGAYGLHRISRLLENTAIPQLQFSQALDKMLSVQTEKLKRNKKKVEDTNEFINAYSTLHLLFQTQSEALGRQYEQIGGVRAGLDVFAKVIEQATPTIAAAEKKLTAEMRREHEHVTARERKARKHFTDYKSDLQGIGDKSFKAKFKSTKSLKEKAHSSSLQYTGAIEAGNTHLQQYQTSDVPDLYCELEALERTRLSKIKSTLLNFAKLQRENLAKQMAILERFETTVSAIDEQAILKNFVKRSTSDLGDEDAFSRFDYALSCLPNEILNDEMAVKNDTKFSVFGTSLEKIMERQTAECKEHLDVPLVMHKLVEAVRENGGCETEGIFRISAAKSDLDLCKQVVDSWDFVLQKASPHLYAATLKSWLRMLEDSLIPSDQLYDRALAISRNSNSNAESYINFVKTNLNPTNLRCLEQIAFLVRDIVAHASVNRMSVDNLAIVFAPSVLRNPDDDAERMMKNSGAEVSFVKHLLLALAPTQEA